LVKTLTEKLNITVMLGGPSAEREVSLRSGAAVAKALRSLGHSVHELDPRQPSWILPPGTDVVFLALHGSYGEDGTVQEQLEILRVPYTGCGPEASRVAFDKVLAKKHFFKGGVPTARFAVIDSPQAGWPNGWQPPVVLKPSRQGSSVGLQFVEEKGQWQTALAAAFRHDTQVLMEEKIA
jgi:D-alanine-D-alanine ligase